ncbi:MAG: aldehyde ferredoxin oxidoreductase family protein [Anaerolineales bacterium]|nr:aldehyde ferredoxin oxidoreductase family protein [Anaerolineales bacterium]
MLGGYAGKFLWVNLSSGEIREEIPSEALLRDFIGGYGIGARVLYDEIPAGADPLGPENILAFLTGPLTGTTAPTATRWTVAAKSPLTGGWGDASGSGYFGVALKKAGFDGVFFQGTAESPVYLYLEDGTAEIRDAGELWGQDTYQIEDWIKEFLGEDVEGVCIGLAGEKQALISAIIHAKGRAAARSGVGAVMGSKKLKLIAARGSQEIPVADPTWEKEVRQKYLKEINDGVGASNFYRRTGTPGILTWTIHAGDVPVKNWGSSVEEFPDPDPLEFSELKKHRKKRKSCYRCPIACWGLSELTYGTREIVAHQPEFQTSGAFGPLTLNNDYPSLIAANDICNRLGLDTISAGTCVAFAVECFQEGLIDLEDTGGVRLDWGDHQAMNSFLEKVGRREDFGDVLADGVRKAAETLGPSAEPFAVHIGGQELPMHDPRFEPGLGLIYKMDPTPGRHTQASQFTVPPGFETDRPAYGDQREDQKGRGHYFKEASVLTHSMNASGMCLFGFASTHVTFIPDCLSAVRGENFSVEDMLLTGERIANMRRAFNIREGINPVDHAVPGRAFGQPPLSEGPTAGIEVNIDQMTKEYLKDMMWTEDEALPTPETLKKLNLDDLIEDIWGEKS